MAALHAFTALQPQCPARPAEAGVKGPDPAALIVATLAARGTDDRDKQLSDAAVTAIAALLIPPEQQYGRGKPCPGLVRALCVACARCACATLLLCLSRWSQQQLAGTFRALRMRRCSAAPSAVT